MKLISWNVNGLRACMEKGFPAYLSEENPDVICLQEIKMTPDQASFSFPGYEIYWNSAEKKGYSGTAILTKTTPLSVSRGFTVPEGGCASVASCESDPEGRVLTAEYPDFYLVCLYSPNVQPELTRLSFRMGWQDELVSYLTKLSGRKPVIVCGDLNVAHEPIDLKNDKTNRGNAGFTDEERSKMTALLSSGFTDTFRALYPDTETYSWWSYRFRAREKNAGWRIDYFLVSSSWFSHVKDSFIRTEQTGSDHCPVGILTE